MRNYEFDDNRYYKARLGLIVLQSDETIEQEFRTILDESISINHSRIYCDNIVSNENLELMEKELPAASALLPDICLLYTSPSPRDSSESRMPSSA